MLLVVDIGNSNIVMGVYDGINLLCSWRLSTNAQMTADEYGATILNLFMFNNIKTSDVNDVIISCVVPPILSSLEEISMKYFNVNPLIVNSDIKTGLSYLYGNPKELGADRIVNSVAGYSKYGAPLIIVDFGTATTFCVLNENGQYLGGAITAGLGISADALFQRTSRLPRIELVKPEQAIGNTTVTAMQSGLIFGYIAQVDGIIKRIKAELKLDPKVIATGGIAPLIAAECENVDIIEQDLTLEGLRIIYELNKGE